MGNWRVEENWGIGHRNLASIIAEQLLLQYTFSFPAVEGSISTKYMHMVPLLYT